MPPHRLTFQFLTIYIYTAFFFALTVVTINHLLQWNERSQVIGLCYNTKTSADHGTEQPGTEITYVVITGFSLLFTMFSAIFAGPRFRKPLVLLAVLHYVVHLYFMIVVREDNQPLLEGTEREDNWDFGQSTAILLLSLSATEVIKKTFSYWRWEREVEKILAGQKSYFKG
jgi:hypothetical protein